VDYLFGKIIYNPKSWGFRILQETTNLANTNFLPSRNGNFNNNIIYFDNIKRYVNIGPNTDSNSFKLNNNYWYSSNSNFNYSSPINDLPGTVTNNHEKINPQFINPTEKNFQLKSSSPIPNKEKYGLVGLCTATLNNKNDDDNQNIKDNISDSSKICSPLTTTIGDIYHISTVNELTNALKQAKSNGGNATILFADGTYNLNSGLWVDVPNIIFRSEKGNRDKVIIKGAGMHGSVSHIFWVAADNITIANISLGEVANHAIQVHGESKYDADNLLVSNVRIFNTGEQMLKESSDFITGSDNGIVECSLFEYTAKIGPQYYIGGIDVHLGKNWQIKNNEFRNIRSPEKRTAEHAIHFWSNSSDNLIEKNKIINCDRGIGFGLGDSGHLGGIIKNNIIYNDGSSIADDVGIGLENANGVKVYNNTIIQLGGYTNAIEYRFKNTNADIYNNLTNKNITKRDNGTASIKTNITNAQLSWFINSTNADLHINSLAQTAINQGTTIASVIYDFDGELRNDKLIDIGADEI